VQLFERSSSGLELTAAGVELAASLSSIFLDLHRAFSAYTTPAKKEYTCRLSTVPSFAAQFLVPRLRAFQEENPELSLQIQTTNRLVDLEREPVDLAIRYGAGQWPNVSVEPLGDGTLLAVCSPALAEIVDPDDPCAILTNAPLIHTHSTSDWSAWLQQAGLTHIDSQSGLMLQDFNVAIKATIAGQGVCLLPRLLVQSELKTHTLRTISSLDLTSNRQFFLVYHPKMEKSSYNRRVMDWLRKEIQSSMVARSDSTF
jgi:LysR family glycine cleavage system transcriptional activator